MVEVYVDGASSGNPGPSGIGIFIKDIGYKYKENIGDATNNVAEATALLRALEIINDGYITFEELVIYTDSAVVHGHLMSDWKCNSRSLRDVYSKIREFDGKVNYKLELTTSKLNLADGLAKSASKMGYKGHSFNDGKSASGVDTGLLEHETPMAYSPTDDSGKLDREPGTDAVKEWEKDLEAAKSLEGVRLTERLIVAKPLYRLHHDIVHRMVIVYTYPIGEDGKLLEGGTPEEVAKMSEEAAIQLITMFMKGHIEVKE